MNLDLCTPGRIDGSIALFTRPVLFSIPPEKLSYRQTIMIT